MRWCESPLTYGYMFSAFKFVDKPAWVLHRRKNEEEDDVKAEDLLDLLVSMSGYWCEQIITHNIVSDSTPNQRDLEERIVDVKNTYTDFVKKWWRGQRFAEHAERTIQEVERVLDALRATYGDVDVHNAIGAPVASTFVPNEIMMHPNVKFAYSDLITQEAVRLHNSNAPLSLGPVLWEIMRLIYILLKSEGLWLGKQDEVSLIYWAGRLFSVCVCGLHARNFVMQYMTPFVDRAELEQHEKFTMEPPTPLQFDEHILPLMKGGKEDTSFDLSLINALHECIRIDARSEDGQARHDTFGLASRTPQFTDAFYVTACYHTVPVLAASHLENILFRECIAPNLKRGKAERGGGAAELLVVNPAFDTAQAVKAKWSKSKAKEKTLPNVDPYSNMCTVVSAATELSEILHGSMYRKHYARTERGAMAAIHLCEQSRFMMCPPSMSSSKMPPPPPLGSSNDNPPKLSDGTQIPGDWWACFLFFWAMYSCRLSREFCETYIGRYSHTAVAMYNIPNSYRMADSNNDKKHHYAQVDPTTGKRAPVGMMAIQDFLTYASNSPSFKKHAVLRLVATWVLSSYLNDPTMDTMLAVLKAWLYAECGVTVCDFLHDRINVQGLYL